MILLLSRTTELQSSNHLADNNQKSVHQPTSLCNVSSNT